MKQIEQLFSGSNISPSDGEAETGPTATAWHAIKYLDPADSGAVLPVLNLNGFKISERTVFGCMR